MAEKRITKKEMFNMAIEAVKGNENESILVDFFKHEIELLNNKKSSPKQTKEQEEKDMIREAMIEALTTAPECGMTITEIQESNGLLAGYQNQKLSALMRTLVLAGNVERIKDGKKSLFKLVEGQA